MDEIELITPKEAGQRLGFGVDHVLKMCRSGQIPAAKIGKRWRIIWPLALRKILNEGGIDSETHNG